MKIVLTGGGTGGHFYPLIAVAEEINRIALEQKILTCKLYYFSDSPYDKALLFEHGITFEGVPAGKKRLYGSVKNFFDLFQTGFGIITALIKLFFIYPDVVFAKGGYASFPTIVAARILRIPIFIHESDTVPGRVNIWAGKHANRVAVSFKEASTFFKENIVAWTGHPIRNDIKFKESNGSVEYFGLESGLPTIFVTGGSQGAEIINNVILDILPELLQEAQVIHQCGDKNIEDLKLRSSVVLEGSQNISRYKVFPFLNPIQQKLAAGIASVVVSRAGSTIFEISAWGIPSIIIPITKSNGDHQRKNAYSYARAGACTVIEETNLSRTLLLAEIKKIITDKNLSQKMSDNAKAFSKLDAGEVIAKELITIGRSHEN